MSFFSDLSIRRKLTLLFMAMAGITTTTISVPMAVRDFFAFKQGMVREMTTLADVMSRNSTAALTFHDAAGARDVLQALQAEPDVTKACLYTTDGKPLAEYVRDGKVSDFTPPRVQPHTTRFERERLIQFRKVVLAGEIIGTIYIESDLRRLDSRLRGYKVAFLGTLLVTLSLAFLLASRLQRPISRPLSDLVQTAEAISSAADYSIRADLPNRDEFGQLVSAFNGMLDQIEKRDDQLREHGEHLEEEVASRTADLLTDITERKRAEEALGRSETELKEAQRVAGLGSWTLDRQTGQVTWSDELARMLGFDPSLPAIPYSEQARNFTPQSWAQLTIELDQAVGTGMPFELELETVRPDGRNGWMLARGEPLRDSSGAITRLRGIALDITERKQASEALWQAEEKYRALFEDAVIGIFQITPEGRPVSINRALAHMHGYDSPEQFLAEVSNVAAQLFVEPGRMRELQHMLDENGVVRGAEVEVYRRDRSKKWALANMRAVRDAQGNVVFYEGSVEDVTDRKVAEEQVQFLAYYDALTALPNRTLLQDRLSNALASARRRNEKIALLFLDLDRFKIINDSLGHTCGDLLLQEVAERLKKLARAQDTIARLGGDEFLLVLTGLKDVADAAVAAARIVKSMTAGFAIQGHSLNISCSLGISVFPEHGVDGETLIKNADAAMYCAKENGRNNFRFFTDDMNAQAVERLTLENSLRLALDEDELFLVYQPQMEIATGRITGLEALLRWQHPKLGLVPPDRFIRIAENSGLIMPIGEWVLRTACVQARKWQDEGLLAVPIAVNVSAVQFRQEGFCEIIRRVLHETGLDAQYLELELTESLLLSSADMTFAVLKELKAMGLKLAIDDFGTGYSSLSYLKQFPVSKLKIDRSFIRDVAVNADDAAITTAIISMAKSLNLKVIAEGVEDEAQMSFLRALQCDEIQGYYFSKPLGVDSVPDKLRGSAGQRALSANRGT